MFTQSIYIPHLEKLCSQYVERFNQIGYELVEQLPNQPVTISMMCEIHDMQVKAGKMEAIDLFSNEEKMKIFEEAKRLTDKRDRTFITKLCKALYTLGQIIQI